MDLVKVEKERAMQHYRRFRRATAMSRWLLEFLAALALLSWTSGGFPVSFTRSAGLLRQLLPCLLNPLSAFLIGNSIILALVVKSSRSAEDPPPPRRLYPPAEDELHLSAAAASSADENLQPKKDKEEKEEEEETAVSEDKGVHVGNLVCSATTTRLEVLPSAPEENDGDERSGETDSEPREDEEEAAAEEEKEDDTECLQMPAEDDGDEFRRRIETFIANQLSFIEREEESLLRQDKTIAAADGDPS